MVWETGVPNPPLQKPPSLVNQTGYRGFQQFQLAATSETPLAQSLGVDFNQGE